LNPIKEMDFNRKSAKETNGKTMRMNRKFAWSDQVQQPKAGPLSFLLSAFFALFAVK